MTQFMDFLAQIPGAMSAFVAGLLVWTETNIADAGRGFGFGAICFFLGLAFHYWGRAELKAVTTDGATVSSNRANRARAGTYERMRTLLFLAALVIVLLQAAHLLGWLR